MGLEHLLPQKVRKCSQNDEDLSKGYRSQETTERTVERTIWPNLSIKMNNKNNCNSLNKIGIHESILM